MHTEELVKNFHISSFKNKMAHSKASSMVFERDMPACIAFMAFDNLSLCHFISTIRGRILYSDYETLFAKWFPKQ